MSNTSELKIGIAEHDFPKITKGEYILKANFSSNIGASEDLDINFHVEGFNVTIPQNEILASYPPIDAKGNFAGVFPHIQFKRSSLPWDYDCKLNGKRIPYIFLLLLKEDEILKKDEKDENKFSILETTTEEFEESLSDKAENLKILNYPTAKIDFLPFDLIAPLAHVRVQEHKEISYLDLPKETSILMSHRMVLPNTKYRAFVCYYVTKKEGKYSQILNFKETPKYNQCVILNEWSFEATGTGLYQVDLDRVKKYKNHKYNLEGIKTPTGLLSFEEFIKNPELNKIDKVLNDDKEFLKQKSTFFEKFNRDLKNKQIITKSDVTKLVNKKLGELVDLSKLTKESYSLEEINQLMNELDLVFKKDLLLDLFEYNGKNLKGMLQDYTTKPYRVEVSNFPLKNPNLIKKFTDNGKIPLEHQLKAGGKMVSFYQGPLTNTNYKPFDVLNFFKNKAIPDHSDYLIVYNQEIKAYDMTYATAWQLGRLMIMNDNKVLQELKKWKSEVVLNRLLREENDENSLVTTNNTLVLPQKLEDFVCDLLKFNNFPIYYLFPHNNLITGETAMNFKIDNSWILSFLYGIFSAGAELLDTEFNKWVLENTQIKNLYKYKTNLYGTVLNTKMIKNWPHLIVNLKNSNKVIIDYKFVTSINETFRLYVVDKPFEDIEVYLKNENAHFAIEFKKEYGLDDLFLKYEAGTIIIPEKPEKSEKQIPVQQLPFELLFKQPRYTYKLIDNLNK